MEEVKMYTQEETADILRASLQTVTMLRELELLSSVKLGRSFVISQNSINRFLEDYSGLDLSNKAKAIEAKKDQIFRNTLSIAEVYERIFDIVYIDAWEDFYVLDMINKTMTKTDKNDSLATIKKSAIEMAEMLESRDI